MTAHDVIPAAGDPYIASIAGPELVPTAAKPPRATAGAAYVGGLASVALIAAGGVGIRDGVLAAGWITGSSWTGAAFDWIDGLTFSGWMTYAGVAVAIVGLGVVVLAIKPRRKTSLAVSGRSSVVIGYSDVARAAASAARAVPGVVDARATATGRKLAIQVTTTADEDGAATVKAAVTAAVGDALHVLSSAPRIVVRTRAVGGPK